jgi:hypothetical protein
MRVTFGGEPFAAVPLVPGLGSVLLVGAGTLSFTAKPALTGNAQFGGHGRLGIPGQLETDTVQVRVLAIKSGVQASTQRYALQAEIEPSSAIVVRAGVFPSGTANADLVKVTALQAKVTPFQAFVSGAVSGQPGYRVTSDEDALVTFAPGSGTNPRVDLVVARVRDDTYDGSGLQAGSVEVVQGTPAPSPVAPAVPGAAIPLWQVTVPGSATAAVGIDFALNRSDRRVVTASSGGVISVADQAERDGIPNPHQGMRVWRADRSWHEVHDGTVWRVMGVVKVPTTAALTAVTSPIDGQVAVAFSTNDLLMYDATTSQWVSFVYSALPVGYSAWQPFTPALLQSINVNYLPTYSAYTQVGKITTAAVTMPVTSTGVASNVVRFSLPVTAARSSGVIGRGYVYDMSASTYYSGVVVLDTVSYAKLVRLGPSTGFVGVTGGGFTAALVSGDVVTYTVTYEAA